MGVSVPTRLGTKLVFIFCIYYSPIFLKPISLCMKYKYASACSMWNKQDELKICVQLQGCNLLGIVETQWDGSYKWGAAVEG